MGARIVFTLTEQQIETLLEIEAGKFERYRRYVEMNTLQGRRLLTNDLNSPRPTPAGKLTIKLIHALKLHKPKRTPK